MANINELITLGIGTPSDIPHFILVGLSPGIAPPSDPFIQTGITWTAARRTVTSWHTPAVVTKTWETR